MTNSEEHNAFDPARLGLALLVVYTHAHLLGGFGSEGFGGLVKGQTIAGGLAVLGFFGISGFLVTRSFVVRGDWRQFAVARLLRILPGLYFSLLLTAFVVAPVIAYCNAAGGDWHWADAWGFVFKNAFVKIGEWSVGGVLSGLPYAGSINGAQWSLLPELFCYGCVLLLGLAGSLQEKRANLLAAVVLLLVLHFGLVMAPEKTNLAPTFLALTNWTPYMLAFLTGAAVHAFRDEVGLGGRQALLWLGITGVLLKFGGWTLLGPVVLPLAVIHTAYSCRLKLTVDLSYGVYILHFPVLQLLSAAGLNRFGFALYFVVGLVVTSLLAVMSWFAVEKPALGLKGWASRYLPTW